MNLLADLASELDLHAEVRLLLSADTVYERVAAIGAISSAAVRIRAAARRHKAQALAELADETLRLADEAMSEPYEEEECTF